MDELVPAKQAPDAYPITNSVVNWNLLLMTANKFFGRSLTRGIDERSWPLDDKGRSLLAVLQEFKTPGSNPHHALREGPLEFIHHSFLVLCPSSALLQIAGLQVLNFLVPPEYTVKEMAIFAGTLRAWKQVLVGLLKPESLRETRQLLLRVLWHFEALGLGGCFRDYAKRDLGDGTYCLALK